MEKPQQPPEGKLIADQLVRMGQSIREAARESGYSEGRLRQIINGYASAGKGQFIRVIAPDEALSKIAWAVGLSINDLRSVGRPAAAELLMKFGEQWYEDQRRPTGDLGRVDVPAIQSWAATPLEGDPPESILELFQDDALLTEIGQRMHRYRVDIKDHLSLLNKMSQEVIDQEKGGGDDGTQASTQKNELEARRAKNEEVSDEDETVPEAADDLIDEGEEGPGESDQRE